jgi:hypothetical protein
MSSSDDKFNKRVHGLHEQAANIRLICPNFTYHVARGVLVGKGTIRPAPHCNTYVFEITYRMGEQPTLKIIDPPLCCRADEPKIPHTYGPDEPCVYRPGIDWSEKDLIGSTIIPWLATWLFYYEIWQAVGVWLGGGEHPTTGDEIAGASSQTTHSQER